jgi:hypothetical protein
MSIYQDTDFGYGNAIAEPNKLRVLCYFGDPKTKFAGTAYLTFDTLTQTAQWENAGYVGVYIKEKPHYSVPKTIQLKKIK